MQNAQQSDQPATSRSHLNHYRVSAVWGWSHGCMVIQIRKWILESWKLNVWIYVLFCLFFRQSRMWRKRWPFLSRGRLHLCCLKSVGKAHSVMAGLETWAEPYALLFCLRTEHCSSSCAASAVEGQCLKLYCGKYRRLAQMDIRKKIVIKSP